MKTLDEVITAFEICIVDNDGTCKGCPYSDENGEPICIGDDKEDALHYLREYQRYQKTPSCMCHMAMCDENNPLTWNELKHMVGKPVWVEQLDSDSGKTYGEWVLIQSGLNFGNVYMVTKCRERVQLWEKEMNSLWKAYRKEK